MTVSNPYNTTITDARSLLSTLAEHAEQLNLAIENRQYAVQAHTAAKRDYDAAEAEFLFEMSFSEDYAKCKNAEAREIFKDAALVKARSDGYLATVWRVLNDCKLALDNAQLGYDQCELQFKATRVAAELMSSMLRAASV